MRHCLPIQKVMSLCVPVKDASRRFLFLSIAVQLEDGHEGFGRHLDGTEVPHLLLARPMKCGYISWGPLQDMTSSAEMNSACGKVLLRKTLVTPHRRR